MTTETANDMMHVVIGWDEDREAPWLGQAQPGDADETSDRFEADIPTEMWQRIEIAERALCEAFEDAAEAAGYDSEMARMKVCCPEWQGHTSPGHVSWAIVVPASGDQEHWPLHEISIGYERAEVDAVMKIGELPEVFSLVHAGGFTSMIRRDSLTTKRNSYGPTDSACFRCGWSRRNHEKQGAPFQ